MTYSITNTKEHHCLSVRSFNTCLVALFEFLRIKLMVILKYLNGNLHMPFCDRVDTACVPARSNPLLCSGVTGVRA